MSQEMEWTRHARRAAAAEDGVGIIEVVVSAMLVVLVSFAAYAGLTAASRASGINKHRSVASEIAQQDQDRMRAMAVSQLSNFRDSRPLPVNGVTYTVVSKADWITDRSGTASCTGTDARANYLRISTQVSWANMRIRPIDVASLVAPPNGSFGATQGTLAVQVNDRNGNGLAGVPVTLAGPASYTDTTNETGCVLWGYLPAGTYTVSLARAGYVDPMGNPTPSQSASVTGMATNTISFNYDQAATIVASFATWNGSGWVAATGPSFSSVSPSSLRTAYGTGTTRTTSISSTALYPAATGYGVYAGGCQGADPTQNGLSATPPAVTAAVNPGATTAATVYEPPINLQVVDGATPVSAATVKLTATGTGCGAMPSTTTDATGFIVDRAQPIGPYTACTAFTANTQLSHVSTTISNTTLTGVSAKLDRTAGVVAGACP
jgi:Tfp pilus assembly protein PilV